MATVALALTGADARPKGGFEHFSKHLTRDDGKSTHTFRKTGHTSSSASVHCSSEGYAASYSIWKNSYIKAGALRRSAERPWTVLSRHHRRRKRRQQVPDGGLVGAAA